MIQNFWSWLHSNSFYNPSKILGTPKWRKLGNPVKPKILARFQKNLVHFHISPGAISRQGIAKIADIGLIFTLITQRTALMSFLRIKEKNKEKNNEKNGSKCISISWFLSIFLSVACYKTFSLCSSLPPRQTKLFGEWIQSCIM